MGSEMCIRDRYTAEEARQGLKQLNAKRGPRFDFLASPAADKETTIQARRNVDKAKRSAFPWIPPSRSGGQDDQRGQRNEEDSEPMT